MWIEYLNNARTLAVRFGKAYKLSVPGRTSLKEHACAN
jgi:hypothetical protein